MKAVAWIALGLSLAGSLLAGAAYWRVRSSATPPAGGAGDVASLKARVGRLEADLAQSREKLARLERDSKPVVEPEHPHSGGSPTSETAELRRRIEALERSVAASRTAMGPRGPGSTPNPALVEAMKKRLTDTSQPERSRASAIGMLRMQAAHKTDDVVDPALSLLAGSTDRVIRALIIRNLQGSGNAKLVAPLLSILKTDSDEDVRDDAARTLGDFVSQAEVKTALEQAAGGDASEKVRRRAQGILAPPPPPKQP